MKKILFFAAMVGVAFTSCMNEEFIGDNSPTTSQGVEGAITFVSGSKAITRGTSSDAALLNNTFVFVGTKGTSPTTFVFDQYTAKFEDNSNNSTPTNSSNWEYVGYTPATTATDASGATQTIKYWDYSAPQYDFAAYSLGLGAGATPTYATATAIAADTKSYTLSGTAAELTACYISDLVTAYNVNDDVNDIHISNYGSPVQFSFRSLGTKIRIAFYETIPGYSVKDVEFYTVASGGTSSTTPALFTSSAVLPSAEGTMTITFPTTGLANRSATDYNKAHVSFAQKSGVDAASTVTFDALDDYPTVYEGKLTTGDFLGRTSNTATFAGGLVSSAGKYYTILPKENIVDGSSNPINLLLRIKYTLVSNDGTGETIDVDNATAVIPAEMAKWSPNYAYTYIFKIGDMTNGSTGEDGSGNIITGLTPVTLDAVVVNSEIGVQETITTVSEPSITTYSKGQVVTTQDGYTEDTNIYAIVNNGTSNVVLTSANAKLYTVTLAAGVGAGTNPAQSISEKSVANALKNGTETTVSGVTSWAVTDANGWILTVTEAAGLTPTMSIAASDSPTGNKVDVDGVMFTPANPGTYVLQYLPATTAPTYSQVSSGTDLTENKIYYKSATGQGEFKAGASATADASTYQLGTAGVYKTADECFYKIIVVN